MLWPEKVREYLKTHTGNVYSLADDLVSSNDPETIIKDCKGKYELCGFEPAVRVPICEEDYLENLYALAFFYTVEIIGEVWG